MQVSTAIIALFLPEGIKKFSNWPTFPQLYLKGELIGGLDIAKVGMSTKINSNDTSCLPVNVLSCTAFSGASMQLDLQLLQNC